MKLEYLLNLYEKLELIEKVLVFQELKDTSLYNYISNLIYNPDNLFLEKWLRKIFPEKYKYFLEKQRDLYNFLDIPESFDFNLQDFKEEVKTEIKEILWKLEINFSENDF